MLLFLCLEVQLICKMANLRLFGCFRVVFHAVQNGWERRIDPIKMNAHNMESLFALPICLRDSLRSDVGFQSGGISSYCLFAPGILLKLAQASAHLTVGMIAFTRVVLCSSLGCV